MTEVRNHSSTRVPERAGRRFHKRKRARTTLVGAFILLLAVTGLGFLLFFAGKAGYRFVKGYVGPAETSEFFENYIEPVVAQDPKPFSDITRADPNWMLKTAIWATANKNEDNGRYGYTDDNREIIPQNDILKSYEKLFGDKTSPNYHTFVDSNGTIYEYNSKENVFYVPIAAISNLFTPKVTKISRHYESVTLAVQYLPSSGWTQKASGTIVPPSPVKTMQYTLKGGNGSYAIIAVKSLNSSVSSAVSSSAGSSQPVSSSKPSSAK